MKQRTLRLGVAGCGAVFERHHLRSLRRSRDWQLVSVCDPMNERRTWVRHAAGDRVAAFTSLSELLAGSQADAILITTPPDSHCTLALEALQAGVHVLVEKPMALTLSDARAMVDASRRAQRHLWVGFSRRFLRSYLDLRNMLVRIPKNRIRDVRFMFSADAWPAVSAYRGDAARGGAVLDDIVSHQLDLLPWLLNLEIREVSTSAGAENGAEQVRCRVRFENGLVAQCDARHSDTYVETVEVELEDRIILAESRHGVAEIQRGQEFSHPAHRLGAAQRVLRAISGKPNPIAESFDRQLAAFAQVVRGRAPRLTGADGMSGLRTVQAIQSCRQSVAAFGRWTPIHAGEVVVS